MEYPRTVDNEEAMLIAEVLDVREDKIVASRVYHDKLSVQSTWCIW
jgi:ketosteroid isomerase-like protein